MDHSDEAYATGPACEFPNSLLEPCHRFRRQAPLRLLVIREAESQEFPFPWSMALEQLQFLEQQIGALDQETASLLRQHQDAVERLAEVPGLGVDSATQIIAEVGPRQRPFLRGSISPRGWAPARATKRAQA